MNNRPTISWVHLFIAIPLLCVVFSFYLGFYYKNSVFVGPFIMKDPILVKEPLGMEDWEWKPFCERMIKSGFAEESWPGALRLKVDPEFIEQQILKIMGNNAGQFPALKKAYNVSELVYFQLPGQTDWPKDVLLNFIPESPSAVFVWSVPHSITANESMSSILNRKVATSWLDPLRWGSLVEFEHVVRTEKKHPRYIRNQWELFHFKMYAGFASLMTFPLYVSLAGLAAAFLLIYFWKSPFLFLAWWWVNLNYLLVHKVLYWPYLYTGGNLDRFFSGGAGGVWVERLIHMPHEFLEPYSGNQYFGYLWLFVIFVLGPVVSAFVGYEYIVKHFIPRHKRFLEDFFKVDKDEEARKQLSIADVEFTHFGFDLKKKLAEYKALSKDKEALFLGMDDNGVDISLPMSLTNQHIHIMGPTGCGKTALAIMPIGIQVISRGYGAAFVDFKGDYGLIQNIAQKCKEEGKNFYYFSINPLEKSEAYNPLSSGNVHSKVDRLINALKLDMEGSASYYTNMQKATLLLILQEMTYNKEHLTIQNVLDRVESDSFLRNIGVEKETVSGLRAKLLVIRDYPMINAIHACEYSMAEFGSEAKVEALVAALRKRGVDICDGAGVKPINDSVLTDKFLYKKYADVLLTEEERHVISEIEALSVEERKRFNRRLIERGDSKVSPKSCLVLKDIMDEGGVVYFNLNSQIDSTVAEAVGRMLIIDLKSWGAQRNESSPRFFIFIDEFQTIASQFFIDVISKVRSANYCIVLANQARANLINVSQAFHDEVLIGSYVKIIFTCPTDAKFWSVQTGSTRIDDYSMRTFAGSTFGDDRTALDGRREKEGGVVKVTKALFTENVFMKLPLGKSIIFVTGTGARMVNHSFYSSKEDFRKNQTSCFAYEGGKLYGDPSKYQQKGGTVELRKQVQKINKEKKQNEENENGNGGGLDRISKPSK